MGKVSMGLECGANLFKRYFGKGAKTAQTAATTAQTAVKVQPMTRTLTDPITGAVTGLEREITLESGEKGKAVIDYLGEGKRKITIFDKDNRAFIWNTKTVTKEKGGSVFGGDRITIDRDYTKYWCYGEKTKLTKDYSKTGTLEHKELSLSHNSGNGLNDYKHVATQDRVYAEYPLKSGYRDMLESPYNTKGIQHSLDAKNNYGNFTQKGTNYEHAVEAKKAAEQAKIAEAEAKKAAVKKAEQEAAERLAASRPRVNTGKIFNKNIEEFKCVEETRPDGSIVRRYFDPLHSANGKSNPMITTIDKGNYHEELIYDPIKGIKLSYKQLGKDKPEIEMTKGLQYRYTSKMVPTEHNKDKLVRVNKQYYNDGASYVEFDGKYPGRYTVNIKNPRNPELIQKHPETYGKEYIDIKGYGHVQPYSLYSGPRKSEIAAQARLNEITKEANANQIDLMDLFRPYQP